MKAYLFLLGVLCVWRLSALLHAEAGPGQVILKLRHAAGDGLLGDALGCMRCLSLWIAAPVAFAIGQGALECALLWPALSAGAITIDAVLQRLQPPAASYFEDEPETTDVQLWQTAPAPGADDADPGLERAPAQSGPRHAAAGGRAGI